VKRSFGVISTSRMSTISGLTRVVRVGFAYGLMDLEDDADRAEDVAGRRSVADLRDYMAAAVARSGEVEMFSAWEGDFAEEAEQRLDREATGLGLKEAKDTIDEVRRRRVGAARTRT